MSRLFATKNRLCYFNTFPNTCRRNTMEKMSNKRKILIPRRQCVPRKNIVGSSAKVEKLFSPYIPPIILQPEVKEIKLNQVESEDDELISCSKLVSYITCASRTLTNVVLYLSSESHRLFCVKPGLFKALGFCSNLKTFVLMLSQLKEDVLNHGLEEFGKKVPYLRKLCLINSVAADQTLNVIMNRFPNLESLGFINCWYVNDRSLNELFEGCSVLSTLNISYCKFVTGQSLMRMIVVCGNVKRKFKFYTKFSGVTYSELQNIRRLFADQKILFKDYLPVEDLSDRPKMIFSMHEAYILEYMKEKRRCVTPKTLDLDAAPPDWDYDSDVDFGDEN